MAVAQEFGESLNESAENLTQLLNTLDQAYDGISAICEEMESNQEELTELTTTVNTTLSDFWEALDTHQQELLSGQESSGSALDGLQEAITEMESQIDGFVQAIEEVSNTLGTEIGNSRTEFDGDITEAKEGMAEAKALLEKLESELTQAWETVEQAFSDTAESISQLQESIETHKTETEGQFEHLTTDIGETLKGAIADLLDQFNEQLSGAQTDAVTDCFDGMEEGLTTAYGDFGEQAEAIADELINRATDIMSNVADHFENSLSSELEQIFQDAIEDAIKALAEEIAESLMMMGIGATVTSAIAPLVPAIVAAKALLGLIKAALEALTFGLAG
jgi:F0F1-type ATP synthase membrane subunit b/b'